MKLHRQDARRRKENKRKRNPLRLSTLFGINSIEPVRSVLFLISLRIGKIRGLGI